jgi:hypothetical protein
MMQRDRAINLFLFFVLAALLFVSFYPVYFSYGRANFRVVDISERIFSLLYVMLWIALCVYSSWKRKIHLMLGGAAFAILAYIPDWVLPALEPRGTEDASIVTVILRFLFERIFELVNAPMVGFSILFSEKTSVSLSKWLLPVLVISYAGTQVFRHYRNAYLADKLHLEETAYYPNPDLAHEIASPRVAGFPAQAASPRAAETKMPANGSVGPVPSSKSVPPVAPVPIPAPPVAPAPPAAPAPIIESSAAPALSTASTEGSSRVGDSSAEESGTPEPANSFDVIDLAAIRRVSAPTDLNDSGAPASPIQEESESPAETPEDDSGTQSEDDATRRFSIRPE